MHIPSGAPEDGFRRKPSTVPTAPRFASASPPPLDYLSDELATAFFDAREHEAYYRSLRTSTRPRPIDARRAYYDTFRPLLLRLLALADDDGIVFLENLITANIRHEKRTPGTQARGCAVESRDTIRCICSPPSDSRIYIFLCVKLI